MCTPTNEKIESEKIVDKVTKVTKGDERYYLVARNESYWLPTGSLLAHRTQHSHLKKVFCTHFHAVHLRIHCEHAATFLPC